MEFDTFFEEILEESKYLFEQAKLQDKSKSKKWLCGFHNLYSMGFTSN